MYNPSFPDVGSCGQSAQHYSPFCLALALLKAVVWEAIEGWGFHTLFASSSNASEREVGELTSSNTLHYLKILTGFTYVLFVSLHWNLNSTSAKLAALALLLLLWHLEKCLHIANIH